ncbi:hypothetical protein NM208_g4643 [Fusarium decemcellulare]|uniref:Uncharacterized protein n=1 Tax=Fusarium decemcellulare TaxID=57161 RepID=A0ACC1SK58_9HYPO|nr:hypothetical protein NM208_g4643 [Fusarium decemcellulare]
MGAVGLGVQDVSKYIQDGVVIACDNGPSSVTLSGDVAVLDKVLVAIKADNPETLTRRLKVEIAYHSHHMKSLAAQYQELIEPELAIKGLKRPVIIGTPFFSSVTGKVVTFGEDLGPDYWVSNLTSRVRFTTAVSRALEKFPNSLFVEIGPHSTLSGPLRQISAAVGAKYRYIPTLIRGGDSSHNLLSTLGKLYQNGVSLDWSNIVRKGKVLSNIPRYAWDHSSGSFWYEARLSKESRFREFGHHRLLGLRIPQSSGIEPAWRNNLSLVDEPWLADHKVGSDVVFPFAGYVAMAGEAIRQHTRVEGGYRVRHAVASSAMVLSEQLVEVVTTLRPLKPSDTTASAWFEFRIVSYNGSSWTQHFEGQIKACTDVLEPSSRPETNSLVRQVASTNWYESMSYAGLVYGPEFQSLKDIVSSATESLATSQIGNKSQHADSAFLFHPASLDNCLQLLLVALTKGLGRNFNQLRVPTAIEDLSVRRSAPVMSAVASGRGLEDLSVEVVADGRVALRLDGLQLTPVDDGSDQQQDRHAAARLEWLPDFDLIDHKTLFSPPRSIPEETRMQEEMTLLCILETADRVRDLKACNWHFEKFRSWLDREISRAEQGTYPILGEDSKAFVQLPSATRRSMIEEYYEKLIHISSKGFVAVGLKRVYDSCEAIFTGEVDTLDTLMQDNVLTEIYNAVSFGKGDFFKLLAHARPDLRILEVGAGTGGTTEMILRNLVRPDGLPPYSLYTFSDISAGFFPQAQERFAYAPNMDYRVFDISQNPFDQGFKANTYDVVLAPNVVHATESLNETLSNLQPLLRSGGLLVLTELCAVARTPNYIFGNFSGWWLGEADGRPWEPYVTVDRWEDELKAAGFSGIDTAVIDAEEPNHYCAAIVSTKVENSETREADVGAKSLAVVSDGPWSSLAKTLAAELDKSGIPTSIYTLSEATALPPDQDMISLLDLESYFFENISKERFRDFQEIVKNHESGRILWLTKPAQVNCEDPRSAPAIGLARSVRSDSQIPFYTLEIKPSEPRFAELVYQVLSKIQRTEDTELLAPDKEYIVDEGLVKIGRYQPFIVDKELREASSVAPANDSDLVKTLYTPKAGSVEQLAWASEPLPQLGDDEVLIDIRTILEVAGVVLATSSRVDSLTVGDRVMAITPSASFKTKVSCPSALVQRIPHGLSLEDAAAMPICFTTAIECLINVGQLEKGQIVLIHSAVDNINHAVIQICNSIGAQIYATVDDQQQIGHLSTSFGIPASHIFDAKDDSFVTHLKRETGGRGVDIVLNLTSSELLPTLWACIAEFGKMIDLSSGEVKNGGHIATSRCSKNASYSCVNMARLVQARPQRVGAALEKCIELYEAGTVVPNDSSIFEAAEVQNAFQQAQANNRTDSIVIKMPTDSSNLAVTPQHTDLHLNADASYLLTGGMGGLGIGISTWLVEHGARSLVFLSRSLGQKPKDKAFIRELESCGCSVTTVAGRAESMQDVQRAISLAPHPIRGVIHLAMVLRDDNVTTMAHQDWEAATIPKIQGAWNLHESLKDHQLDFFVMTSSIVTVVEQPGQGNYVAANTFLEAFTQYRRSLSLPASVLNVAPIEDVGFVAENAFAKKNIKGQGLYFLREVEVLHFLELAIRLSPAESTTTSHSTLTAVEEADVDHFGKLSHKHPWTSTGQLIMGLRSEGDLNDPNTRTNWRRDRRMGFYHNENRSSSSEQQGSSNKLSAFLASAADNPNVLDEEASAIFLAQEIGSKVFSLMLKNAEDLDTSLTLQQVGLDSLMAIELRRWWQMAFNFEVSVLELMATGTIEALGVVAAKGLKQKLGGA